MSEAATVFDSALMQDIVTDMTTRLKPISSHAKLAACFSASYNTNKDVNVTLNGKGANPVPNRIERVTVFLLPVFQHNQTTDGRRILAKLVVYFF